MMRDHEPHGDEDAEDQPLLGPIALETSITSSTSISGGSSTCSTAEPPLHLDASGAVRKLNTRRDAGHASLSELGDGAQGLAAADGVITSSSGLQPAAEKAATSADAPVCRICLEEDDPSALESPCRCAGTQRYAHRSCIQRWINEKCDARCEICGGAYSGAYTTPPPPRPPAQGPPGLQHLTPAEQEALQHILTRLAIAVPGGGDGDAAARQAGGLRLVEVSDAGAYEERQPSAISWSATLATILLFLLLLHSNVNDSGAGAPDPGPGGKPGGGGGSGGGGGTPGGAGGDEDAAAAGAGLVFGLTLFAVWVLGKLLMLALPLLSVSRMWQQPEDEDNDDLEAGRSPQAASGQGADPAGWFAPSGAPTGGGSSAASSRASSISGGDGGGGSAEGPPGRASHLELQGMGSASRHPFVLALRALQHNEWRQHSGWQEASLSASGGAAGVAGGEQSARLVGMA